MIQLNDRLKGIADREKWAARGATFVTKLKATKAVWFPPEPVKSGKNAASTAKKASKRAAKKPTSAARKTTSGAKKATKSARPKKA